MRGGEDSIGGNTRRRSIRVPEIQDRIFSGIEIVYFESHTVSFEQKSRETASTRAFEIAHCHEGRLEYELNREHCYRMPGDLAITQTNKVSATTYFPLRHYHGITIRVDLDRTPRCLSCFLEDVNVEPEALMRKFCSDGHGFIVGSNRWVEHIFSELYAIPDAIRMGYQKVKILELFLFLSAYDIHANEWERRANSAAQARLAGEVMRYLTEYIAEHVTLKAVSEYLHISETHIKKTFQTVYGVMPKAFFLEQTDLSVLAIANALGYENASKFSGAFRRKKGLTPMEYRNRNQAARASAAEMEQKIAGLEKTEHPGWDRMHAPG